MSFYRKICPAMSLHGIGIVAVIFFVFSSLAWGNTQDEELAEKFSPILILTEHPSSSKKGRKVIFPEPVEIMGAESVSNLWFYFLNSTGDGSFIHKYPSSGWSPDVPGVYQSTYSYLNFSKNKFSFLPGILNYSGTAPSGELDNYFVLAYFDYPGKKEKGPNSENWYHYYESSTHPQRGSKFDNTAYVYIFQRDDGKTVIQYYYFYPFNDFANNHEGDWQSINVIVTSRDTATADIDEIDYKFHGKGLTYTSIGGRLFNPQTHFAPAEGGTHPVVYVGAGSHGGYPTGGNYPLFADEDMTKDGIVLSTNVKDTKLGIAQSYDLVLLPEPDTTNTNNMGLSSAMSWLGADVRWGTLEVTSPGSTIVDLYNSAPSGPFHNGNWGKTGTSSYSKNKVPYTEFQQFPIVQNVTWRDTIDLIGDIVIYPGATLTIEPGTVIRAYPNVDIHGMEDTSRVDIVNHGALVADASGGQQIVFEGRTYIHPSNLLLNQYPKAGDWYGIRNYGTLTLKNCKIQHAVTGLKREGTETLRDVVVTNSKSNNTSPFTVTAISNKTATQYKCSFK